MMVSKSYDDFAIYNLANPITRIIIPKREYPYKLHCGNYTGIFETLIDCI